jgi:hypothetical protein
MERALMAWAEYCRRRRRRRRRGPRDSHESAVGRLAQLTDEGRSDTALRDRRLRDRRERADASVRSTGLGVAKGQSTWHEQGYC